MLLSTLLVRFGQRKNAASLWCTQSSTPDTLYHTGLAIDPQYRTSIAGSFNELHYRVSAFLLDTIHAILLRRSNS